MRVEAVPLLRLIGAVHAVAIDQPRFCALDIAVKHLVRAVRQLDPGNFAASDGIEQA